MPVSKDDALAYIGLTDADLAKYEDVDAFKAAFDDDWLKRSEVHKDEQIKKQVLGKLLGVITTNGKRVLTGYGETVTEDDLKDVKIETLIDRIDAAAKKHFSVQIAELTTKVEAAKSGSKTEKELQEKLTELHKKADQYKQLADELNAKLENKDKEFVQTQRTMKEKELWDAAMAKAPFRKDLDPLTRTGFEAVVRGKVRIAWDEEGKPYTADANGNRIKDTSKSNSFLELEQVIAQEVVANKLNETNPHSNKIVGASSKPAMETKREVEQTPGQRVRTIHPAAAGAVA